MNMWGFSEGFLQEIKAGFAAFLKEGLEHNPLKCEYFLPTVVSNLLKKIGQPCLCLPQKINGTV